MITLSSIRDNREYKIKSVAESELKLKLFEMGFCPGQEIQLSQMAPFGDPLAVQLGNQVVMLRKEEASLIELETV